MVALYVHIPFCKRKCRYCDFVSYENSLNVADAYVEALLKEAKIYNDEKVATVFIGGGTPSLLAANQFKRLVCGIFDTFDMSECTEFTVEANPESITEEKIAIYKNLKVNRISIGLQSCNDTELKLLGRIHNYDAFLKAYDIVNKYFDNINIDLISGLPNQNVNDFKKTLESVVSLKPQHISVYSLIPEDGTPIANDLKNGIIEMPDEDTDREIYEFTGTFLNDFGYKRYEISNYALEGFECNHNLTYWTGGEYIGLGCAAHSMYKGRRSQHSDDICQYINAPNPIMYEDLSYSDNLEEYIMLRLRLTDGFSLSEFKEKFGYDILEKNDKIKLMKNNNLINIDNDRLYLTEKGINVCDSIILQLI